MTRPRAFLAERLGHDDGVLTILQTDYQLSKEARIEAGAWRYSVAAPALDGGFVHDQGAYVSLEAPMPLMPRTTGWVRLGFADRRAQTVAGYIGVGAVQSGTFADRPDDRLGIAIAQLRQELQFLFDAGLQLHALMSHEQISRTLHQGHLWRLRHAIST